MLASETFNDNHVFQYNSSTKVGYRQCTKLSFYLVRLPGAEVLKLCTRQLHCVIFYYTPYEGLNLANQNNRKLEAFGRKLVETSQNCI